MRNSYSHLFGPVLSRRLGRSLGVNLVPKKTCNYDCVYCECGPTTCLTAIRREYVPVHAVISELNRFLEQNPILDHITFGGYGEPTLNEGIGRIAEHLAVEYPRYRTALLTNGALFSDATVRNDVCEIDILLPSLDTVTDEVFSVINKPVPPITADTVITGLEALRDEYNGEIWLEIFIIPGLNDTAEEIEGLHEALARIRPDRVQLNTLDRPGVAGWVVPAAQSHLELIAEELDYPGVEVILFLK
ncbi:MAG: radical SAM protein [Methanospirillaceae archaeon]|nr:radical SAM protein [Methanospirillaceae archaeon]